MNQLELPADVCRQSFEIYSFGFEDSDFTFNLSFLQKIVSLANEENFGILILSLLNLFSIWFDLGVLDLHPFFPLFHDYLLVCLYLYLPVFLFDKISQLRVFTINWLKKIKSPLNELLESRKETSETS